MAITNWIIAQTDTLKVKIESPKKSMVCQAVLPSTILIAGVALNHSKLEKDVKQNVRNAVGTDFEFKIDDYIQYVPMVEMYGADMMGLKAKNHWFDQSKYLAISQLTTAIIVQSLKFGINKTRPNGANYSFPSGHTSQSFTGATVLYHEFNETHPLIAYSGFLFSTTTGAFRIINNKHWLSDVLMGAGIGILVTNLVYHFEPLKNFNPFKNDKRTTLLPYIDNNEVGFYFTKSF